MAQTRFFSIVGVKGQGHSDLILVGCIPKTHQHTNLMALWHTVKEMWPRQGLWRNEVTEGRNDRTGQNSRMTEKGNSKYDVAKNLTEI